MFGANQKMVEAQVARKKEKYMNNEDIARTFQLYKSEKVGLKIDLALGSSLKAVALKSALKLKATWLILDRKMKNDEEYFLQKLSCGILRVRRFNKIIRLRGPLHLPHESRPSTSTNETNTDSIPLPDISTEHLYLFSTDTSPNSKYSYTLRLHLVACTHDINCHLYHLLNFSFLQFTCGLTLA
ncbi:uncharacterized protein LOC128197762 [Vigna angularis]|nr:uncharacterized protein LOC128197762 [Vigna angularis]